MSFGRNYVNNWDQARGQYSKDIWLWFIGGKPEVDVHVDKGWRGCVRQVGQRVETLEKDRGRGVGASMVGKRWDGVELWLVIIQTNIHIHS